MIGGVIIAIYAMDCNPVGLKATPSNAIVPVVNAHVLLEWEGAFYGDYTN